MMRRKGDYYVGLDIGTDSVGWAVSDKEYNIEKFKGNAMWGIRLFDEAKDASGRRTARTARRRLARRKWRLDLLETVFADEINKKDPGFFVRMSESSLWQEDKGSSSKYALFNDPHYTDKDYMKRYPTIYHLRSELLHSGEEHDVRLVFLALYHIIKNRGHFLYESESGDDGKTFEQAFEDIRIYLSDEYGTDFEPEDFGEFKRIMTSGDMSITEKKKLLRQQVKNIPETEELDFRYLADMLSGAVVGFADIFCDKELKNAEASKISLKNDLDEVYDKVAEAIGSRVDFIILLKTLFDIARLSEILGENAYLSDAKIKLFEKNREELKALKKFVKENASEEYKNIFSVKSKDLKNYPAYSGYKSESGDYSCSREDFCAFLDKKLPGLKNAKGYEKIYSEIKEKTFLTKLRGTENGIIPHQLQRKELVKILENASGYLEFLKVPDENGFSPKEKVISIFDFKIPYYVGPLNKKSERAWIERKDGTVYPWNFREVVDEEKCAEKFIGSLIGKCSYTYSPVIPKNSLLYSEFSVLNEINAIKINGRELPSGLKERIYRDLFVLNPKKVTKKGIEKYLRCNGLMGEEDELSGVDVSVKSSLKSYHDFKGIIEKYNDTEMVENIIRSILVFGNDKRMLRKWLGKNCGCLDEKEIDYVCRLKYSDWGNLSKEFLTEIYSVDENGEATSIMDCLRHENKTLMQLLTDEYQFAEKAEKLRNEYYGEKTSLLRRLDDMYIAPAVSRSVWQSVKIIDEITGIKKTAPEKIFIEVARGNPKEIKKARTESRKSALMQLYKKCGEDSGELWDRLCGEEENRLRRDKLYLYYTQFGKCMYSGEPIEIDAMLADDSIYDIDHIFPRSRVKDNSIDNRVLVKSTLNREKTNTYPISEDIRNKMLQFWTMLRAKEMISEKKFERLKRNYPLTDKELSDFVARQIIETQQSTKAVAALLKELYPETKIVYSKAGNVSDFRQQFGIIKSREANDLHHAKDAYLNIVVGNVYDTKFTENFFMNIGKENYSLNRVFDYNVPGAWDKTESKKTVQKYAKKNNILFTRMPYEAKGQLFDLNIMPAGKGQLPIKEGLPIERYGGYNKISGAYFAVIEHTEKGKRIRTLEPVYIYKKDLYEKDPVRYCEEVLGLKDPAIISQKIRMNALLEIDGKRLNITGRTGSKIIYKHSYQMTIDGKHEQYIKNAEKYIARCTAANAELPVTLHDGISKEENIELFDWFCQKLRTNVYYALFRNMLLDMEENRNKFASFSELEQCRLITEILKAFKCDRQCPNFKMLNGKGTVGILQSNKKLSSMESAYLVNQSVTGIYEVKVDLLK